MTSQKEICKQYDSEYKECDPSLVTGVADNVDGTKMPINGLRHPLADGTTGWYIWAGEELLDDPKFFKPLHTQHLIDKVPEIEKYLGLAPGWRFLLDPSKDYIDVWYDPSLLSV